LESLNQSVKLLGREFVEDCDCLPAKLCVSRLLSIFSLFLGGIRLGLGAGGPGVLRLVKLHLGGDTGQVDHHPRLPIHAVASASLLVSALASASLRSPGTAGGALDKIRSEEVVPRLRLLVKVRLVLDNFHVGKIVRFLEGKGIPHETNQELSPVCLLATRIDWRPLINGVLILEFDLLIILLFLLNNLSLLKVGFVFSLADTINLGSDVIRWRDRIPHVVIG